STSSHSEQRSQARQSRWYCRNRWESRSVPFFIQKPLLYSRGFFVFVPFYAVNRAIPVLSVASAGPSCSSFNLFSFHILFLSDKHNVTISSDL
ncbi:hypothetical protein, partial [Sphingobacterium sp. JUb20]|uniref:hypothetical protein n=2 Tax=Sphingobacterium TaxID=28453 RepID=UPI001A9FACB6